MSSTATLGAWETRKLMYLGNMFVLFLKFVHMWYMCVLLLMCACVHMDRDAHEFMCIWKPEIVPG